MFLSRLSLDLGDKDVLRDLGNAQAMHRTVMSAFPPDGPPDVAREAFGVLHRVEWSTRREDVSLLVQSAIAPDWSRLPIGYTKEVPESRSLDSLVAAIGPDRRFAFRLRANPTRKVGTSSKADRLAGTKSNGRRVPVREEEQEGWLAQKALAHGFHILHVIAHGDLAAVGRAGGGWRREGEASHRLTHKGVVFDGVLHVKDVDLLVNALRRGIGPAKAYGFGLLSLASPGAGE